MQDNQRGMRDGRILWKCVLSALCALVFMLAVKRQASAQTTLSCLGTTVTVLDFASPVLEFGTDLEIGAIYRFSDITPGVDALVEIIGFDASGGLNIIDRDTGLINYFQPELTVSGPGGVDFRFSFVDSVSGAPVLVTFSGSSIDVDGNNTNLREYVEFETTASFYFLNTPTELDVNASGPSASDRIRFESRTFLVAPGISATALPNIVTTVYTNVSSFEFRIGALGTGAQTRLTSLGFNCPALSSPVVTSLPSLAITKTADSDTEVIFGQTITYTYTVENTGNVIISNITLADIHGGSGPAPTPSFEILDTDNPPLGDSNDAAVNGTWDALGPDDVISFTSTYVVTQSDVDTLQ